MPCINQLYRKLIAGMKQVLIIIALFTFVTGCETNEEVDFNGNKLVLRYNESAGISYLDPAYSARFEDSWAIGHLFNGLVQFDNELNVVPCIASKWEVSEDGLVYTFLLRSDVTFHDDDVFANGKGRKVKASDFVNSFFRICDAETASPGQYIFQNVNTFMKGTTHGFFAENDSVFKIYLNKPQSDFLMKLTLPFCSVVPIEAVDEYGDDFRRHPIGTGPFQFKLWQEDVKLVLVKNQHYFETDDKGVRLPYVDAVSVSFMDDKTVEIGEFIKGKFDFISGFHPSIQTNLLTQSGKLRPEHSDKLKLIRSPWLKTDYIGILVDPNQELTQKSSLRSREIRRAINYSIDKKGLVKYFRSGIGIPAEGGFIPEGMPGYNTIQIEGYSYNPEKAKELLFESGLNLTEDEKNITLLALREYKELCEYIKKELEEIGLEITIELVPASVFKQRIAQYESNFFRKSWTADYPDASNFMQLFYSKNESPKGPNYTHFKSTFFDNLYELAMLSQNKEERLKLFHEMEQIIFEEAPVIPLFYDESIRITQNNISGLTPNAMNSLDLKRVKIDKK
jgi:oligopeptide transport system substrate-binding protein